MIIYESTARKIVTFLQDQEEMSAGSSLQLVKFFVNHVICSSIKKTGAQFLCCVNDYLYFQYPISIEFLFGVVRLSAIYARHLILNIQSARRMDF